MPLLISSQSSSSGWKRKSENDASEKEWAKLQYGATTNANVLYQPNQRGKPENPLTKMTFKIPRRVHQKLLEIAHAGGTSQQELLTQALSEWLAKRAPEMVPLLTSEQ